MFGRAGAGASSTITPTIHPVTTVPYVDARGVLGLSAVWRCITLIADTLSDMPWQEWRGDEQMEPVSRLVRRPFALRTRRWWTWRNVATEALYNRCYNLHVGGTDSSGRPWSLLPLPPDVVQPVNPLDPWGISFPDEYSIAGTRVRASQVTIVERAPFPNVSEALSGLLSIARMQFGAMLAADTHTARYWQAGGPTLMVVSVPEPIDNPEAEKIAQRVKDRRSMGADYPLVLGKGGSAEGFGADPTKDSATEARREINAEVGRYFGVPTRILNAPAGDSETYSNVENDAIDLWRYTLRGYAGPIEDAISELLPGDYIEGRRMILQPERFLQGDLASRASAYSQLVGGAPIMQVDEARRRGFQMPPMPAGAQQAAVQSVPNVAASIAATSNQQEQPEVITNGS